MRLPGGKRRQKDLIRHGAGKHYIDRGREDVECGGQGAGLFSVDIEEYFFGGFRLQGAYAAALDFGEVEVVAAIEAGHHEGAADEADVAEDDEVEEPVGGICVFCYPHAAGEVLAVCYYDVFYFLDGLFHAVDGEDNGFVFVGEAGFYYAPEEGGVTFQDFVGAVDDAHRLAAEAEVGDIYEVSFNRDSIVALADDAANVEGAGVAGRDDVGAKGEVPGNAEGFYEVAACAGAEDSEGCGRVDWFSVFEKTVDSFVYRAVAADARDEFVSVQERAAGDVGRVARALREFGVEVAKPLF